MISQRVFDIRPEDIDVTKRWIEEHIAFDGNRAESIYDWYAEHPMDHAPFADLHEFATNYLAIPYGFRPPVKFSFGGTPISYVIEGMEKAGVFEGTDVCTPEAEAPQEQISELPQDAWTLNF